VKYFELEKIKKILIMEIHHIIKDKDSHKWGINPFGCIMGLTGTFLL
jgi:hypothetical protein